VGVGVSGGPDSMALLHALHRVSGVLGCSLVAIHVDHGLRPAEAEAERTLVRGAAESLGLECVVEAGTTREEAARRKLCLEEAARELRYAIFADCVRRFDLTRIALAHTADDQAEELLIRLLRGGGRRALAGMRPLRDGWVARPFLGISKQEILAYLQERKISFCSDSSNDSPAHLRNRVRHELLPFLAERFQSGIRATLLQTADILGVEDELLNQLASEAFAGCAAVRGGDPPSASLELASFGCGHPAVQRRVLERTLILLGAKPSFLHIERLRDLVLAGTTGDRAHLANGLRAERTRTALLLSYPGGMRPWRGDAPRPVLEGSDSGLDEAGCRDAAQGPRGSLKPGEG